MGEAEKPRCLYLAKQTYVKSKNKLPQITLKVLTIQNCIP